MAKLVNSMTFPLPLFMHEGLKVASKKFRVTQSDIMRSVLYDFLISSGTLPQNEVFDSQDDVIISAE